MIRPFSLSDLESILQIESRSFPKSPYDWATFLNLHDLYPETFLVCVTPSAPQPQDRGMVRVDPERRLLTPSSRGGLGPVERVNTDPGLKEEILGYIIFSLDGHIISIAVHPRSRRKGIGTRLLQRAMKTPHLKKVWAEVRRSNHGAQAFYFEMGFQIAGIVPNYYGNEDALIIQRTLG